MTRESKHDAYDLIVDGLAAFRLVRLWTRDSWPPVVAARDWLTDAVEKRHGPEWAEGVTCPWCVGLHCAGAVVLARLLAPRAWSVIARGLAIGAIVGLTASDDRA